MAVLSPDTPEVATSHATAADVTRARDHLKSEEVDAAQQAAAVAKEEAAAEVAAAEFEAAEVRAKAEAEAEEA
eukprot:SAG22_NODE_15571_length_345_cov_1.459350_1_plen_72_part_10